ncbi:branched-chain amino acid ABC transporter permease [Acetobacterium paludosum]|uniref:Branched-chain amino acid ABC transporter permease n=2 Tax=Acetobacterium TaxID=33951 RepID=A0A923HSA6_9FIRM|nr:MULTISPECIES: branched-chain amino acid ABC transporter permease [Acetobacterium]MBC3887738.1 branched-chain amino acid ABC transporter permease [Acetobacterium paludosum]
MTLSTFLQQLINGLSLGSLYALIAIGYTMVYGILKLINFAHGDIFMMAAYFAYFGISVFFLPWYVTFIITILLTMLLGAGIERMAYRPLREAPKTSLLISAIGVSFLLENLATYLFSGKPQAFPEFPVMTTPIFVGGLSIQPVSIVIPIVAFFLMTVLLFIINKTKVGMAMRAVSVDYDTAKLMGIKIDNVISSTFAIGSGLAAVGALLWCMKYPSVLPLMGVVPGLKCFIAAVIGGIGNVKGAVLGGLILGFSEVLMVAFFPSLTGYRDAVAFIILIIILLFLPNGILGKKQVEKV